MTPQDTIQVLASDIRGLKELFLAKLDGLQTLIDVRHQLYAERDSASRTAVEAALTAVKENTASSFTASEKAITKAENAQQEYNVRSNEFRGQLDDQAKRLIPRSEVDVVVRNLQEKIDRLDTDLRGLKESRSELGGQQTGGRWLKDESRANVALVFSGLALLFLLWRTLTGH